MSDYKRKKVRKSFIHKKNRVKTDNNIVMTSNKKRTTGVVPENDIKVVRGKKYEHKKRTNILISIVAVIGLIWLVLSLILPVGLYENIVNLMSLIGHGKYPIDTSGSTVLNTYSNGSYYYVLTDTSITAYSNSGKNVLNEMHGFSNPIMSVSDTRVLVYDQGENTVCIYNLGGEIHSLETENEIITANISRNGSFAIATHSDSFTSVVSVYDKNFEKVFTWNSAKDIINNVLVNPSGNRLAVSTLNAESGQYISKVLILNFESPDPLHTLDMGNAVTLSLVNTGKGISVITADKYKFLDWSKFNTNEVTASGEINLIRNNKKGILLVFNRANDRGDNTVVLISNSGEKTKEFKINNIITDIQYKNGRVYYINDTTVNILDNSGNILRHGDCSYGTQKFAVIASNSVATITDTQIEKIVIEKGEN